MANIVISVTFVFLLTFGICKTKNYDFTEETPSSCQTNAPGAGYNYYFDISQLACRACANISSVQRTTADGLGCECQPGYKKTSDFGGGQITCLKCDPNQVTSSDGWECVNCDVHFPYNPSLGDCSDPTGSTSGTCAKGVQIERTLNGSWYQTPPSKTCQSCEDGTLPDADGQQCFRCSQILSVQNSGATPCTCTNGAGGVCFKTGTILVDIADTNLYTVSIAGQAIQSQFFKHNIQSAQGMCQTDYNNRTACQVLGNMCAMITYTMDNEGNTIAPRDACSLYLSLQQTRTSASGRPSDWKDVMPWLYYLTDPVNQILQDTSITMSYSFPNTTLDILLAAYSYNGTFLQYFEGVDGTLQMCSQTNNYLDAAFIFGTNYVQQCNILLEDLISGRETIFYDIYLRYSVGGTTHLYPIPVKVQNYMANGVAPNTLGSWGDNERWLNWQLTRRFYLVDKVSGVPVATGSTSQSVLRALRYASSIVLTVRLQSTAGLIYPPFLTITYSDVSVTSATDSTYNPKLPLPVTFQVEYIMDQTDQETSISIAVGVLAGLAMLWAVFLTWVWSKRTGQIAIDCVTLIKYILYCVALLANIFFVVTFGYAMWCWIVYKDQNEVQLFLPNVNQETMFIALLSSALVLKFIQLIHLIITQVTVDIFLIDWERPKGPATKSDETEAAPSIWRTYFIANEWNELQTCRKINVVFQIFTTVFFLVVVGFQNLATADPISDFDLGDDDNYHAQPSRLLRYAIGALAYLLIAICQWVFFTFIYERFFSHPLHDYVDLCSISNISVFIMENTRFGYYIHGRTVHGQADTGLREMALNMKREEDDMCGKRGLEPDTLQQTFQMALPQRLRDRYDSVLRPLLPGQQVGQRAVRAKNDKRDVEKGGYLPAATENNIAAYKVINKFFQNFIDHSLKKVDYIIKDKTLLEKLLSAEFEDATTTGIFYNDDGHSFEQVLFYGHENTLTLFELLLFCIIDLIAQDFVLAGFLTYLADLLITNIRDGLGRSNLAKKTLVDKRFLI